MPDAELDHHQQTAVAHGEGPAIVLAGPGSGKTRVVVARAERLIDEGHARPEELLVLTFSRKAASDLRQRLADGLRRSYASFPVTTFHSFCFSLLQRHMETPPRLALPAERRRLIEGALDAYDWLDLPRSGALAAEALAFCELSDDYLDGPDHPLARVRDRYRADLAARGALDYGGLQREAERLLREDEALRARYAATFRYVLVDEYQDTNVAQDRLLRLIAGEHRNVFVVADEDQSIYGFRGAELENTLRFGETWPGATRYDLPTNYRSAPAIVDLAADVIRRNIDTHQGKALAPAEDRPSRLVGRTFRHAAEEADWIAREIAALRLDGVPLGEIAILTRSVKEIGPRLAYALRSHGIPFHAPLASLTHPTVAALVSVIELALPDRWDSEHEALALRTLASPLFGADPLQLRPYLREQRTLFGSLRDSGEFQPFFQALGIVERQKSAGAAVYALWSALDYFRGLQERCRHGPSQDDVEELEAVTALSDAANAYDGPLSGFPDAFRHGELDQDDWLPARALPQDAVALLTVHQAKGLEWEAVFVCDLVEGRFPALARSEHALFDRADFADVQLSEGARARLALEEERRLFYVAITRAKTRLFLSATEEAREEAGRSLSRFFLEAQAALDAMPAVERLVSVAEAEAARRRAGGGSPGWRDRDESASLHPMLPDDRLRTSATSLGPYEDCPLAFYYGSLLSLARPSGDSLVFGGIVHDVLEAFHDTERAEPQTLERLLELADEHWQHGEIRPRPFEVEYQRRLRHLLTNYFNLEVAPGLVGEVLAVERRFVVDVENATLSGRIDRIDRRPDSALRLVDYKSSKKPMGHAEAEADLQLALYALACHVEPELHELGEVGEIVYLYPRHTAHGKIGSRSRTVTPDLVATTRERIVDLVEKIAAERFDFSAEADCKFCDFKPLCPRHHGGDVPV